MRKDIHPKVHNNVTVTCACGNSFVTSSTLDSITIDICSACHPFYTGQQKFVDTEGRIEKFEKKLKLSKEKQEKAKAVKEARKQKKTTKKDKSGDQTSLKDLLKQSQAS